MWRERERELWCNLERERKRERDVHPIIRDNYLWNLFEVIGFFCPWTIFLSIFGRNHSKSAHNKLQRCLASSNKHTRTGAHIFWSRHHTLPDPKLQCFYAVKLKTLHTSSKISAIKMTSVGKLMRVFPLISFCILRKWCNAVKSIPRTGNIAWLGYFTKCLLMCMSVKHFTLLLFVS